MFTRYSVGYHRRGNKKYGTDLPESLHQRAVIKFINDTPTGSDEH
jgi:hypothetical protein